MKYTIITTFVFAVLSATKSADFDGPAIYQVTYPIELAETPTWDGRNNILYYVDVIGGRVYSYNYNTTEINFISFDGYVTPVIPCKNNENLFIIGLNRSVVAVEWDGKSQQKNTRVLTTVSQQFPTSRMNDGKADKEGRLWFGTMGFMDDSGDITANNGVLYKITRDNINNPTVEISPVDVSNGLAWNQANNKFYYIDSLTLKVLEYDYDNTFGNVSNPRVAVDIANYSLISGIPDGMTIDKDDNLWIAVYGGGSVIKANPKTGELLQVVALPAGYVTSLIWGGPNFDILFVTTSRFLLTAEERKMYPAAGSVFAITNLNTSGLPAFNADIIDSI